MSEHTVGMWMYQNGGGDKIEKKIVSKLKERDIEAITGLNLRYAVAENGKIICNGFEIKVKNTRFVLRWKKE